LLRKIGQNGDPKNFLSPPKAAKYFLHNPSLFKQIRTLHSKKNTSKN
jgi:hypothetical protein